MTSAFDHSYSKLHSYLQSLHPLVQSMNDEISQIFKMSTTDEIEKRSASVAESLVDAHLIVDDYRDTFNSIETKIEKMSSEDGRRDEEQQKLDEFRGSTDGTTEMEVDPVRILSTVSKLERKLSLSIESAKARIIALNRTLPSNIIPSTGDTPTTPFHSTSNNGVESTSNTPPPTSSVEIQALTAKLVELEAKLTTSNALPSHQPNIVLPPITLETFDGNDITKWPAYKYQLDQLILNQPCFTEVEKVFYVRSSLKGTAHSLISSIPTNKDFLPKMIKRLENEYGRPNLTQAKLLQTLLRIRSKSPELTDQLDCVRAMINIVHSISDDCGLDGIVTQQQIADRIHPRFIPVIWRDRHLTLLESLQSIEETLRIELEDVTMIKAISDNPQYQKPFVEYNSSGTVSKPKSSVKDSPIPNPKVPKGPTCVFCGLHAISGLCTIVKSAKDRKEILRRKNLCFCCLSSEHPTAGCSRKCTQCEGEHHRSVCEKQSNAVVNTVSLQQPERLFATTATVSDPSSNSSISVNTQTSYTHQSERLFTVDTQIANPDPAVDNSVTASILLDHDAQANLITRDLADRLSLVPFDQCELTISGFNDDPVQSSTYDIVKLDVVTDRDRFPIEAVILDKSPLSSIHNQPLDSADLDVINASLGYVPNHLTKHKVTHSELLLSVGDTLEMLENSKVTKLPSGFHLIKSSLGPFVVGKTRTRIKRTDPLVSALTSNPHETRPNLHTPSPSSNHSLKLMPVAITSVTIHRIENDHSFSLCPPEDSTVNTHCNSNFNNVSPESSILQPLAGSLELPSIVANSKKVDKDRKTLIKSDNPVTVVFLVEHREDKRGSRVDDR